MAHLTCELHNRRAMVIERDATTGPLTRLLHRSDGTRCGDQANDFTKYRGHTLTSFSVMLGNIPKTQALTRKQRMERTAQMLLDAKAGRVVVVQQELPPPR